MEISKREKKNIKIIPQIIAFKELFENVQWLAKYCNCILKK